MIADSKEFAIVFESDDVEHFLVRIFNFSVA